MGRWMLTNGKDYDVFPDSEDDVLRFLTEVDALARNAGEARIAVLTADSDAEGSPYLSIGVGAGESVLAEFLGWMLVSQRQAFDAAGEFYRTGQRPTKVEWRDL